MRSTRNRPMSERSKRIEHRIIVEESKSSGKKDRDQGNSNSMRTMPVQARVSGTLAPSSNPGQAESNSGRKRLPSSSDSVTSLVIDDDVWNEDIPNKVASSTSKESTSVTDLNSSTDINTSDETDEDEMVTSPTTDATSPKASKEEAVDKEIKALIQLESRVHKKLSSSTVQVEYEGNSFLKIDKIRKIPTLHPCIEASKIRRILLSYFYFLEFDSVHACRDYATKLRQTRTDAECSIYCEECAFRQNTQSSKHQSGDCPSDTNSDLNRLCRLSWRNIVNYADAQRGSVLLVRQFRPMEVKEAIAIHRDNVHVLNVAVDKNFLIEAQTPQYANDLVNLLDGTSKHGFGDSIRLNAQLYVCSVSSYKNFNLGYNTNPVKSTGRDRRVALSEAIIRTGGAPTLEPKRYLIILGPVLKCIKRGLNDTRLDYIQKLLGSKCKSVVCKEASKGNSDWDSYCIAEMESLEAVKESIEACQFHMLLNCHLNINSLGVFLYLNQSKLPNEPLSLPKPAKPQRESIDMVARLSLEFNVDKPVPTIGSKRESEIKTYRIPKKMRKISTDSSPVPPSPSPSTTLEKVPLEQPLAPMAILLSSFPRQAPPSTRSPMPEIPPLIKTPGLTLQTCPMCRRKVPRLLSLTISSASEIYQLLELSKNFPGPLQDCNPKDLPLNMVCPPCSNIVFMIMESKQSADESKKAIEVEKTAREVTTKENIELHTQVQSLKQTNKTMAEKLEKAKKPPPSLPPVLVKISKLDETILSTGDLNKLKNPPPRAVVNVLQEEIDSLQKQLELTQMELKETTSAKGVEEDEIVHLKQELTAQKIEIAGLKEASNQKDRALQSVQKNLTDLEANLKSVTDDLLERNKELKASRENDEEFRKQTSEYFTLKTTSAKKLKHLEKRLTMMEKIKDTAILAQKHLKEEVKSLQVARPDSGVQERNAMLENIAYLESTKVSLERDLATQKEYQITLRTSLNEVESALVELRVVHTNLEENLKQLETKEEEAAKELAAVLKEVDLGSLAELKESYLSVNQDQKQRMDQLEAAEKVNVGLEARIQVLNCKQGEQDKTLALNKEALEKGAIQVIAFINLIQNQEQSFHRNEYQASGDVNLTNLLSLLEPMINRVIHNEPLKEAAKSLAETRIKLSETIQKLETSNDRLIKIKTELNRTTKDLSSLKAMLQKSQKEKTMTLGELIQTKAEVKGLKETASKETLRFTELNKEIESIKLHRTNLQAALEKASLEQGSLKTTIADQRNNLAALLTKANAAQVKEQNQIKALRHELEKSHKNIADLETTIKVLGNLQTTHPAATTIPTRSLPTSHSIAISPSETITRRSSAENNFQRLPSVSYASELRTNSIQSCPSSQSSSGNQFPVTQMPYRQTSFGSQADVPRSSVGIDLRTILSHPQRGIHSAHSAPSASQQSRPDQQDEIQIVADLSEEDQKICLDIRKGLEGAFEAYKESGSLETMSLEDKKIIYESLYNNVTQVDSRFRQKAHLVRMVLDEVMFPHPQRVGNLRLVKGDKPRAAHQQPSLVRQESRYQEMGAGAPNITALTEAYRAYQYHHQQQTTVYMQTNRISKPPSQYVNQQSPNSNPTPSNVRDDGGNQ